MVSNKWAFLLHPLIPDAASVRVPTFRSSADLATRRSTLSFFRSVQRMQIRIDMADVLQWSRRRKCSYISKAAFSVQRLQVIVDHSCPASVEERRVLRRVLCSFPLNEEFISRIRS
ncbi:hypothetical protein AVEN_2117-1 [Araneus ventricosus]|uniref:Uncharacterized protein n=1 Tax=Araneus ventricosus TaxID=182803 RepID=A0A4Y2E992_ARAVE|nr:hypothetical protein AVEN_2117-1 [Araneus ventricosus]